MMAVSEVSSSTGTGSTEFLPAQRYMGVNRFSTRGGDAGAKWEEQWTHREYSMLVHGTVVDSGWQSFAC